MKRILVAATAILAASLSTSAFAQGWWDGPEVGVQGGYAWGTSRRRCVAPGTIVPYSFRPSGGMGGAHAGYNWQWDHFVLGLEGDAEGGSVTGRFGSFRRRPISGTDRHGSSTRSVRGKLG